MLVGGDEVSGGGCVGDSALDMKRGGGLTDGEPADWIRRRWGGRRSSRGGVYGSEREGPESSRDGAMEAIAALPSPWRLLSLVLQR